jgi:hypothetical protein
MKLAPHGRSDSAAPPDITHATGRRTRRGLPPAGEAANGNRDTDQPILGRPGPAGQRTRPGRALDEVLSPAGRPDPGGDRRRAGPFGARPVSRAAGLRHGCLRRRAGFTQRLGRRAGPSRVAPDRGDATRCRPRPHGPPTGRYVGRDRPVRRRRAGVLPPSACGRSPTIGVLEELTAAGVTIDRVAGVRMGAVVGALFRDGPRRRGDERDLL